MRTLFVYWMTLAGIFTSLAGWADDARVVPLAKPDTAVGQPTDACRASKSGRAGGPVKWTVIRQATATAQAAVAETTRENNDPKYPICMFDAIKATDLEIAVDLAPREGEIDRAGGLIVRARDDDNYYVLRSNALENNVRLYRTVNGQRQQFAGVSHNIFSGKTHRLSMRVVGDLFTVSVDGKRLFEGRDSTINEAGMIGLWSKSDSLTEFSNLSVTFIKD